MLLMPISIMEEEGKNKKLSLRAHLHALNAVLSIQKLCLLVVVNIFINVNLVG